MALIDNIFGPTEQIGGRTQSEWGDRWWQWNTTIPQDDNPVRDRTGDFAAINQTGSVYFLAGEGNGIANRKNVVVPAGKYLFFPTSNLASLGNNIAEFGGDTRFVNSNNPGGIGDIAYFTQLFNNPANFSLTIDGTSVVQSGDAKKYIQSSKNLTDGFSFTTPENSSIFPGAVPDGTTWGKNYQTGYYIGLKPLAPGKHTIHFTTTVAGSTQDINYEIEVKSFNEISKDNANNTINGTAGHDDIDALGGSDTVNGFGGDDIIDAGAGDDTVAGGDGNDIVYGGAGKDTLNGDAGDDVLAGGLADDIVNGGLGNDRLYGGSGKDTIKGDGGDDTIFGGLGNDVIDGGLGNDTIDAVAYSPLVLPEISGAPGSGEIDTLKGGVGKDLFVLGMAGGTGVTGNKYYLGNDNSDYALIQDFTPGTDGDKIQLYSQTLDPSEYKLESSPAGTPSGVGIFAKRYPTEIINFFTWDLVGIIQGVPLSSLSLTNSSQFTFVNDTPPVVKPTINLAVAPATVAEDGTNNLVYTFTRTGATTSALTVNYGVAGTAGLTSDYTQTGAASFNSTVGTVTFAAGATTAKVTINPNADTTVEANETVRLTLTSGAAYTVGSSAVATGTIVNDDSTVVVKPTINLAVAPATVAEDGTNNLVYTFTRTGATTSALTVNYGVAGTAGLTSDYTQTGAASFNSTVGTVTFAAGATTAKVTINPNADTTVEANETVLLTLTSGAAYTVGSSAVATGTIVNDDTAVVVKPTINLAVAPATVAEDGTNNLVYTFTRTGATTSALTVNYGVAGTAGLTSDYTQTGAASFNSTVGTVTFAAGATTAKVTINPNADTTVEANETVRLTLTSGAAYTVGTSAVATGTIVNDDSTVITNSNVIAPTQNIDGKTQSQLGDEWWRWGLSVTQSDNPITASTGDFAGINQSGKVQFLTGSFSGTANRNVVVSSQKSLFFPLINSATIGNDLPNFDTRQDDFRIWNRDYARQPKTFKLTLDGTSVINNPSDALKYLQQNSQTGGGFSSYFSPENNVAIGGGIPDQTNISGNYQKGYFVGLKPLAPGKHTITFEASYLLSDYLKDDQGAFVLDSASKKILIDAKDKNGQPVYNSQQATYEIEVKSFNEIAGNNSDNTINGTAANDDVDAFGGNDTVSGYGGDDTIDLGAGDDTAYGGDGNDIIYGGAGEDRFYGDNGDDVLAGGLGDDTITGGYGNDRLYGGAGRDTLTADIGDDIVFGGADNDGIDAGLGNDIIDAVAYSPLVLPVIIIGHDAERNHIFAKAGQGEIDIIKGARGNDTFVLGSAGTPYYVGNGKNDYALIQDFTLVKNDPQNADKIQLYSENLKSSDYVLGSAPSGTPSGVGIFTNNAAHDLIAILQGVSINDLSLNNTSQFSFVS